MAVFDEAFVGLLSKAPSPLFPKARALYLRKYALETASELAAAVPLGPFRTFLFAEDVQESQDGVLRVEAQGFALVHWQAAQTNAAAYIAYLRERWNLSPEAITLCDGPWFRDGGAYAVFQTPALMERRLSGG